MCGKLDSIEDLSSLLRSKTNMLILQLLSTSRMYTREIAQLLGKDEAEISRRLTRLRRAGLIDCSWERIGDKNVKICYSLVRSIKIEFTGAGIKVIIYKSDESVISTIVSTAPQPRTIPVTKLFVGRRAYLEELEKTDKKVILVWGLPGIGKTYLVAKHVSRLEEPVYWYTATSFSNLRHFAIQLAGFLETLGHDRLTNVLRGEWDPGLVVEAIIDGLESRRVVLVIDDYYKISDDELLKAINDIIESIQASRLIIISRMRPRKLPYYKGIIHTIRLRGFEINEVAELVKARNLRIDKEKIVELYIATQGVPALVSLYLDLCSLGRPIDIGLFSRKDIIDYVVGEIYTALNPGEKIVFETLSLLEEPAPLELLEYVTGMRSVDFAVKNLEDMGLVEYIAGEGYVLHSLLRRASREIIGENLYKLAHRIGDYYLSKNTPLDFYRALMIYYKYRDIKGVEKLVKKRIIESLDYHMGFLDKYYYILDTIRGWDGLDSYTKFILEMELGHLEYIKGDFKTALQRLKPLAENIDPEELYGDEELVLASRLLSDYAEILVNLRLNNELVEELLRVIKDIAYRIRDPELRERVLIEYYGSVGLYKFVNNNYDEALKYYMKRLELKRVISKPRYYVATMIGLANIYLAMKNYESALEIMDNLEQYLETNKLLSLQAILYTVKAETLASIGRLNKALEYASRARDLLLKIGTKEKLMQAKAILSAIYYALEMYEEALNEVVEVNKYYKGVGMEDCNTATLEILYIVLIYRLKGVKPDPGALREKIGSAENCWSGTDIFMRIIDDARKLFPISSHAQ